MKKLFILLTMLIVGIGSMWAETTPFAGAYPVEGKIYYLYAQQTKSGTPRSYLYNDNGTLKISQGSKSATDAYKWTVTINNGKYIIKNVNDKTKYLCLDNKLILSTSWAEFDLSKTVQYSASVSLFNQRWWATPSSGETFPDNYYISSFTTSNDFTASFVFEEVLSAHSLENGKFYTIYCDNDNKQYLYDNAGTLAQTSSAPDADYKYIWECIVSDDNYNFRNLQTGKYLGWKEISASAYNYTITTTQAIHDGCATMWGVNAGKNWSIKNDGTLTGQTTTKDDKVTSDWCTDFRFDEVDLSDWCTGTDLGGTLTKGSNTDWSWKWSSPKTPSYRLEVGANNINKTANNTGGLDIRTGSSVASYNICAPDGYVVTGYKFIGYALKGDQTVTPSKGGVATVFTTAGKSISVSGLRQSEATFNLSGANEGLFIRALQVSLAPIASITSLPTASNKAYVIHNRYTWNFANEATAMNSVANGKLDLDDTKQQIALIYYNENYYIYSINAKKFLTASNTLTDSPTTDEQITITATNDATYPWFFKFKNIANKNINIDGKGVVFINDWNTLDGGNKNAIIEAVDFDPKEAFAAVSGFNKIIAELERYTYGLGLGKYHVTAGEHTYYSEVNGIISGLKAAGYSSANLTTAQNLKDGTSINLPSTGKFYRFKSNVTGKYIGYAGSGKQPMVEETNAEIYFYTEGKSFLNYNSGRYLSGAVGNAVTAVGTVGPAFSIYETGYSSPTLGTYRIRVSDDSNGSLIDWTDDYLNGRGDGDNARCEWIIEEVTSLPLETNSDGYTTFSAPVPVTIPSDCNAFIAKSQGDGVINLEKVIDNVAANTGLIISTKKYDDNELTFNIVASGTAHSDDNLLVANVAADEIDETNNYFFGKYKGNYVFTKISSDGTHTLAGHKAYLDGTQLGTGARISISWDIDNPTGIDELKNDGIELKDGKYYQKNQVVIVRNGVKYNVAGQVIK